MERVDRWIEAGRWRFVLVLAAHTVVVLVLLGMIRL